MLLCMRTTISIDDELFRTFKARAAERGTTLSAEIEEALRVDLARRTAAPMQSFELITNPTHARPGVDLDSNAALDDLGI